MDFMLQMQADELSVPVLRPTDHETTALGAAYLAGLAEGAWDSLEDIGRMWHLDARFEPRAESGRHSEWKRAVERSLHWVEND